MPIKVAPSPANSSDEIQPLSDRVPVFVPTDFAEMRNMATIRAAREALDTALTLERESDRVDYMYSQGLNYHGIVQWFETVEGLEKVFASRRRMW